jgi:hypothetical protein
MKHKERCVCQPTVEYHLLHLWNSVITEIDVIIDVMNTHQQVSNDSGERQHEHGVISQG